MSHVPYGVAIWLFFVGLYGIVTSRHWVHAIICLVIVQSSSYVLLSAIGYRHGAGAPVFSDVPPGTPAVDPIVQALMLTDVVVEVTVMAVLLALAVQAYKNHGNADPNHASLLEG